MVERPLRMREARGSIYRVSIIFAILKKKLWSGLRELFRGFFFMHATFSLFIEEKLMYAFQ